MSRQYNCQKKRELGVHYIDLALLKCHFALGYSFDWIQRSNAKCQSHVQIYFAFRSSEKHLFVKATLRWYIPIAILYLTGPHIYENSLCATIHRT